MASPSASDYEESGDDVHDEEAADALWGRGSPSPSKSPSPRRAQAAADDSPEIVLARRSPHPGQGMAGAARAEFDEAREELRLSRVEQQRLAASLAAKDEEVYEIRVDQDALLLENKHLQLKLDAAVERRDECRRTAEQALLAMEGGGNC